MRGLDRQRTIDLGAARVTVASPISAFNTQLDFIYRDQEISGDEADFADLRVALRPGPRWRLWRPQVALWSEAACPFEPYPLGSALPLFEWGSNWLLVQRLNAYLLLHAGVVARGDRALILPAAPGSGKSTLTCALNLAGWRFLSDEFGVVDPASGALLPLLKPAALKNHSIAVIGGQDGAVLGPVFHGTRKGDVAHYVPDRASVAARQRPARPALVVFPRYRQGAALRCTAVGKAETAMRLGLNSFNYRKLGPLGFDTVVRLVHDLPAWEIEYGALADALPCIERLFGEST